ncbi:hypothetical protein GOB94_05700 [Granulicella sp. 5B5]|uniref:MutS-related protein n=1 Tax=Granulicella sp. 5B5 TaxID=1617967 RepID=UPI0015F58F77|nr:hypothetical protein [Granulicella sp. 5B5]QMV18240.1 hypothetical protein GOB94_05700 [Granulicella sp. 5B5]
MAEEIVAEYERRRSGANVEFAKQKSRGDMFGIFVAALVVMAVRQAYLAIWGHGSGLNVLLVLVPLVALTVYWRLIRARERKAVRLSSLYATALDRVNGVATQTGHTGESLAAEDHIYAWDLDVVGRDSLLGMLATTRTAIGQKALAELLLEPTTVAAARKRQAAVKELTPALDLRERVALLGASKFEEIPAETYERWLEVETEAPAVWIRPLLIAVNVGWIVLLAVGWARYGALTAYLRPTESLLLAQAMICLWLRPRARQELAAAKKLFGQTTILRSGLRIVQEAKFESERLLELQRECAGQDEVLRLLERWLMVVEHREKEWFSVLTVLFCGGTQALFGLRRWKKLYAEPMRRWLAAWSEMEALLALATYAAEHAENVYAEIVDTAAVFEAVAMVHPLLPRGKAVANDVALGGEAQFLLISGSNMAGKSTLLRTIGVNAVLALAGAPVPAKRLRLSALRIGASLAVRDSLAEGKSKFLAEVERLRAVLTMARENPAQCLFLIDEILSGTNSADRRAAAGAVLRGLLEVGAIGALSTHDLALAELAEIAELSGRNVHMASPNDDDPLEFDYLLKPGVNRTTNALAIVRLLGLMG